MKKYKISFNEKIYEVEVEELEIGAETPQKAECATGSVKSDMKAVSQQGEAVEAPISGKVLDVKVKVGDTIKKGETLLIIEAMKLENEVVAPKDGKVTSVSVSKGDTVVLGDNMITLQ